MKLDRKERKTRSVVDWNNLQISNQMKLQYNNFKMSFDISKVDKIVDELFLLFDADKNEGLDKKEFEKMLNKIYASVGKPKTNVK